VEKPSELIFGWKAKGTIIISNIIPSPTTKIPTPTIVQPSSTKTIPRSLIDVVIGQNNNAI